MCFLQFKISRVEKCTQLLELCLVYCSAAYSESAAVSANSKVASSSPVSYKLAGLPVQRLVSVVWVVQYAAFPVYRVVS